MVRKRLVLATFAATLLVAPPGGHAEEKPQPVDPELLEFLGGWDSEDAGWTEFLAANDIPHGKEAKEAKEPEKVIDHEQ